MDLDASMKKIDAHISRATPLLDRLEAFLAGAAAGGGGAPSHPDLLPALEDVKALLVSVGEFKSRVEQLIPQVEKTVADVQTVVGDLAALRETVAPVIAAFEASPEATSDQTAPKG